MSWESYELVGLKEIMTVHELFGFKIITSWSDAKKIMTVHELVDSKIFTSWSDAKKL